MDALAWKVWNLLKTKKNPLDFSVLTQLKADPAARFEPKEKDALDRAARRIVNTFTELMSQSTGLYAIPRSLLSHSPEEIKAALFYFALTVPQQHKNAKMALWTLATVADDFEARKLNEYWALLSAYSFETHKSDELERLLADPDWQAFEHKIKKTRDQDWNELNEFLNRSKAN